MISVQGHRPLALFQSTTRAVVNASSCAHRPAVPTTFACTGGGGDHAGGGGDHAGGGGGDSKGGGGDSKRGSSQSAFEDSGRLRGGDSDGTHRNRDLGGSDGESSDEGDCAQGQQRVIVLETEGQLQTELTREAAHSAEQQRAAAAAPTTAPASAEELVSALEVCHAVLQLENDKFNNNAATNRSRPGRWLTPQSKDT